MTLTCRETRDRFESYAAETLGVEERRGVREHLGACDACRDAAALADPLFVFAAPRATAVRAEEAGLVLSAVRAGLALKQAERRLEPASGRRRVGAFVSAAAVLALTLLVPGAPASRAPLPSLPPAEREAVKSSFVPAVHPAPAPEVFEKTGGTVKYPADATIYDLNPGAGQPRVVWIGDRSIDI